MSIKPSARLLISVASLLVLAILLGAAQALDWAVPDLFDNLLLAAVGCLVLVALLDVLRLADRKSVV